MIPQSFQIMGHTVKIMITDDMPDDSDGEWRPPLNQIRIRPVSKTLGKVNQEQIFWHETVHCILDCLSYKELSKDEAFVDRVAQCLFQIDKAKK